MSGVCRAGDNSCRGGGERVYSCGVTDGGIVLCGVGMIVGTIVVTSCGRDSGDKDTLFWKRSVGHRVEDTDTCSEDTSVIQIETGHVGGQLYRRSPYRLRTP